MPGRYALIKDGVVVNLIVADAGYTPPEGYDAVPTERTNVGDAWDGEQFIPAPTTPTVQPPPRMTEEEKEALIIAQSEMIALLFEMLQGGGTL